MGEIAEDMSDGSCCDLCGQYFKNYSNPPGIYVHEYPATCWDCWEELTDKEKESHQKSDVQTF